MPYTKDNPPDRIKGLPKHAQEIWISAYNSAIKQYDGDEEKANATAWAAVKKAGYKKNEKGEWVKMSEKEPNFDEVEIFEIGLYPQGHFTRKHLDEIIENYDANKHEAPATIDHAFDGPAHGWVEKIWRKGNKLCAKLKEVSVWLRDQIKSGAYKKRSIEIWEDYEGTGKKMLKAVSFLGAMIPQVKGLKNVYAEYDGAHGRIVFFSDRVEFKATEEEKNAQKARSTKYGISIIEGGHVTKPKEWSDVSDGDFGDPVNYAYPCPTENQTQAILKYWDMSRNKELYPTKDQRIISNRLREFAKKFGIKTELLKHLEVEDMDVKELEKLIDEKVKPFKDEIETLKVDNVKLVDGNKEMQKQIDAGKKTFSEQEKKARETQVDNLVDRLLKEKKIVPAVVDAGLKQFLMELPPEKVLEFGEKGEDKQTLEEWITKLFSEHLPKVVEFKEIVGRDVKKGGEVASFKVMDEDGERNVVSAESLELNEKALKYAKENKVEFKEALVALSAE